MSIGDWIAIVGDAFVALGIVFSIRFYLSQLADSEEQKRLSALASLAGAKEGINKWAQFYFPGITKAEVDAKAKETYDHVMDDPYPAGLALRVPTEQLAGLLTQPHEERFVHRETIEAVNIALLHFGYFNQFTELQTTFYGVHGLEIMASAGKEREAFARHAVALVSEVHRSAITHEAKWYRDGDGHGHGHLGLMDSFDENIRQLDAMVITRRTAFRRMKRTK